MLVRVIIVDNDEHGHLEPLVQSLAGCGLQLMLVSEPSPGKSAALNAALAIADADYVGFVDDDEELTPGWFDVVYRTLNGGQWDFAGGRCLPRWPFPPPAWLPDGCSGVLGLVDSGPQARPFGRDFPGILSGGNAVVSLPLLRRIGGFSTALGPRRTHRFLSGEDEEMYLRLLEAGARGIYVPDLAVYHYIHPHRLTRDYYRRWFFWNGVAKAMVAQRHRQPVPYLFGIPRYVFGHAVRGLASMPAALVARSANFGNELPLWHMAGFIYGRQFYEGRREPIGQVCPPALPARDLALMG